MKEEDIKEESENLNQNLIEEGEGETAEINNQKEISEVPNVEGEINVENNISSNNNVVYDNQPSLEEKITSHLGPNDNIKIEYSKAIFSEFEKILQYDPFSNTFISGLDFDKPYPYHFNPALINIRRYRNCCQCCDYLYKLICKNTICEKILFFFNLVMDLKNIFSILTALDLVVFISAIVSASKYPTGWNIFLIFFVYAMSLFFESRLLYYKLPAPISPEDFRKKVQNKIQTGQRIYFGDDKKVVPLVYHSYRDISGTLEFTKPFNIIKLVGRPGTYFLDGKTIREFNKSNEEFRLRGGNCKYYINYEDSPNVLNTEMNYETQTLNDMFTSHEINELIIQNDELIYLAPQGFEKWNKIAIICFFFLVGEIYNNYFCLNLGIKSYKIRKALFFEEPEQEIDEKLQKYQPKITYQGNVIEFELHSEKIKQNIIKPYFEKWDDYYNEKNIKDYI